MSLMYSDGVDSGVSGSDQFVPVCNSELPTSLGGPYRVGGLFL